MKRILIVAAALLITVAAGAQKLDWSRQLMDGSRTGCSAPGADNVTEALGTVKGSRYNAPNGKTYKGGATPKVAAAVLAVQPRMADLKQVVCNCPEGMVTRGADSPLANFACDVMLMYSEQLFGRKADFAVMNSGGIRADVPKGDVLKDDMVAIFPFHNHLVLVEYPGQVLLDYLKGQAARRPQPFGGARIEIENHELKSAKIDGKDIDPNGTYYMVTIDFLLGSGDNMRLGAGATDVKYTNTDVIDIVLDYMLKEKAAGRPVQAYRDGRVTIIGEERLPDEIH